MTARSCRLLCAALLAMASLCACAQADRGAATDTALRPQAQTASAATEANRAASVADADGHGPDRDEQLSPPDGYHGNWRLVATADPHDSALMALTIQSSTGERDGSGDFVLFQPFCDAVAGVPISGSADCELIDLAAAFDRVQASPERIVLVFHPTADGAEHRLELHRDGEQLRGHYITGDGDVRLAVVASRTPDEAP